MCGGKVVRQDPEADAAAAAQKAVTETNAKKHSVAHQIIPVS